MFDQRDHASTTVISTYAETRRIRLPLGLHTSGIVHTHYLQRHTHITELVFCQDNDDARRKRAVALASEYADNAIYTRHELLTLKNYNEVFLNYLKKNGGAYMRNTEKTVQKLHPKANSKAKTRYIVTREYTGNLSMRPLSKK